MAINTHNNIKLIDLIKSTGIEISDYKIHCAIDTSKNNLPLEKFFAGEFQQYQEHQTKKNFNKPYILSLIYLGANKWLFSGLWKCLGVSKKQIKKNGIFFYKYNTELTNGLEHLTGRAIISFEKNFRASYLIGSKYEDQLYLSELREEVMSVGDFPGYNSICLSFNILKLIINQQNSSWKGALSNVSGIYIITDTKTGKHYIGSAYGGEGLWQRWSVYSRTGHGNNKELKKLLNTNSKEYAENFQF